MARESYGDIMTTVDYMPQWEVSIFLEGFLYGIYSGVLAIYLQYQASKEDINKAQKILTCSICALYVTTTFLFLCDIANAICSFRPGCIPGLAWYPILVMETILFACSDFISQFILIYRCWIVWGHNIRIVIIPSILAFAFLGTWLATEGSTSTEFNTSRVAYPMTLTALALSLTVNALVTGLIVFRIFKVFRQVRATSDDKNLSATGGSKLRCVILVIIESAMGLFSIQLARLVLSILDKVADPVTILAAIPITTVIHQMLNGITPTIILVRTSMGLSFHDEKSMEEVAIGSLRFASNQQNSVSEIGNIGTVGQEMRDDPDDIDVRRSNDIDVVER